ncbi:glycosyltransferase family 2 protein [Acinetobacter sp. CUI P1]|nr:glycosyltransferase family 2 protein [Acinetobacter sp. CUI P1]
MSLKYSVIIPVFKVEEYLTQCIDSIINQAYENLEIILVDDGSPDQCPKICDDYARMDSRIKVIHQKNQGQSAARNTGVKASTGDFLLFLDSDDYLISDIFTSHSKIISDTNVDIVFHNYRYFNCLTNRIENSGVDYSAYENKSQISSEGLNEILGEYPLFNWYPWQFIIKRDILSKNNLFFEEGILYEDVELVFKLIVLSKTIVFNNCYALMYRINRLGATTNIKNLKPEIDRISVASQNINWVKENVLDEELGKKLNNNFACMLFTSVINYYYIPKKDRKVLYNKIIGEYHITKHIESKKQKYSKRICDILGIRIIAKILYIRSLVMYRRNSV